MFSLWPSLFRDLIWPPKSEEVRAAKADMAEGDTNGKPPYITLVRGSPNPSLLPIDLIRAAANKVLSDPSVAHDGLLYGPDPGYEPCREAIAKWLTASHRPTSPIGTERILISGGASQNLGNVLNVYTDAEYTRAVWIVVPAYMLVFRMPSHVRKRR